MRETKMTVSKIRRVSPQAVQRVRRSGDGFFLARLAIADEGGQVLPWVVVMLLTVLGVAALVVDCGRAMVIQRELQASTDAAALAAATQISGSSTAYSNYATTYGSGTGGKNAYPGLNITGSTATPLCLTTVKNWNIPCTLSSGKVTIPNAIQVTQTASVPTLFAGVLGKPSVALSATSTATNSRPQPYNIALIVDSTLSMSSIDSNCNNVSGEQCALQGVQQLLAGLSTYYDHIALFTFPNVAQGSSQAGVIGSDGIFDCTTSPVPSSYSGVSYYDGRSSGFGYTPVLFEGSGYGGTTYQPPYPGISWDMPYSYPPIPSGTSGYVVGTGNLAPTYEITPFLEDYNDGSGNLKTSSNLVMAVGGQSNCNGIAPGSYDGNYGTYYAGALYAAQAALLKEQANHANSSNVMIILGDGDSNSPRDSGSPDSKSPGMPTSATESETTYKTSSSLTTLGAYTMGAGYYSSAGSGTSYPSYNGECGQAVDAAQYAATYSSGGVSNPTKVYTIAYGALTSGHCTTDTSISSHKGIQPCQALQEMATQVSGESISDYFYSDWAATGGDSGCTANSNNAGTTAISDIYQKILASLVKARLIPNGTT